MLTSCNQYNKNFRVEESIYNFLNEVDYELLKDITYVSVSESHKELAKNICLNSVDYSIVFKDSQLKIIITYDDDFKTAEGYSTKTNISKLLQNGRRDFYVEPDLYIFILLDNNWRAIIKSDSGLYPSENVSDYKIIGFCKIDEEYSNAITVDEWKQRISKWYFE